MGLVAAFLNLLPSVLLVLSVTVKSLAHRVQSLVVLSLLLTPYTLPLGGFTKKSAAHRLSAVVLSLQETLWPVTCQAKDPGTQLGLIQARGCLVLRGMLLKTRKASPKCWWLPSFEKDFSARSHMHSQRKDVVYTVMMMGKVYCGTSTDPLVVKTAASNFVIPHETQAERLVATKTRRLNALSV